MKTAIKVILLVLAVLALMGFCMAWTGESLVRGVVEGVKSQAYLERCRKLLPGVAETDPKFQACEKESADILVSPKFAAQRGLMLQMLSVAADCRKSLPGVPTSDPRFKACVKQVSDGLANCVVNKVRALGPDAKALSDEQKAQLMTTCLQEKPH